jgi:hypothetical protein
MRGGPGIEGVLITGAYGSGTSAVATEMADRLEERSLRYVALGLDWLTWADTGSTDPAAGYDMLMKNLASVLADYLDAGMRLFILAGAFSEDPELESFAAALPFRLKLIHLTVPLSVIEERLRFDLSAGRHDELREATARVGLPGVRGIEHRTVSNDRRIVETAVEILDWLGWT